MANKKKIKIRQIEMRETHTPITVFTLQLPKIYSKEGGEIQLKKGDELGKENMQENK